jgi:hypothetical protein
MIISLELKGKDALGFWVESIQKNNVNLWVI